MSTQNLENTITLSEAFYKEIDEHRIPAEREVIATLAHAPEFSTSICRWFGKVGPSAASRHMQLRTGSGRSKRCGPNALLGSQTMDTFLLLNLPGNAQRPILNVRKVVGEPALNHCKRFS